MSPKVAEISYSPDEGLTLRFNPKDLTLLPEATRSHLKTANKEFLLALRSLIDQGIQWMDRPQPKSRRPRRIQVQIGSEATEEETE